MIDPDFQSKLEDAEEHAPKRLSRKDVADIRALLNEAKTKFPNTHWTGRRTFWLARSKDERAIARLGRAAPCVVVTAAWSHKHEFGLDVEATAHCAIGRPQAFRLRVGRHRFRHLTSCSQFSREVSHLIRLGLGWTKHQNSYLSNILG